MKTGAERLKMTVKRIPGGYWTARWLLHGNKHISLVTKVQETGFTVTESCRGFTTNLLSVSYPRHSVYSPYTVLCKDIGELALSVGNGL